MRGAFGDSDPTAVVQRVMWRSDPLRWMRCYSAGLGPEPVGGRVEVQFTIDATGKVTEAAERRSDLRAPSVIACVLDEVA